ncbi:anthranilate phosphoribosyltransferase [Acidothermaceae bacterium B102]|nr:anthranilate phosphoribosyltransferase [Acidothermaceae bacterium B102]
MTTPPTTWPSLLTSLLHRENLTHAQSAWAMEQVMGGEATPSQIAGFAIALRAKGETPEEVEGLVGVMLRHAAPLQVTGPSVDTCGTGGDRAHTVNISSMAALVVAGVGVTVVKHGNRAASSSTGSADVLEELGVVVDLPPAQVARCIDTAGIGFCFAPVFHPALRFAGPSRRELGVATVFNFLGPLCNPAQPSAQAVGVYDARMAPVMAAVLARRGTSALVFRGDDGLDELSTATTSRVWLVRDGAVHESVLNPVELGIAKSPAEALRGGDRARNAEVVRELLAGQQGPVRDAVLLNAAAALVAATPGEGSLDEQLIAGIARGAEALDSGAAAAALDRWVTMSKALAPV